MKGTAELCLGTREQRGGPFSVCSRIRGAGVSVERRRRSSRLGEWILPEGKRHYPHGRLHAARRHPRGSAMGAPWAFAGVQPSTGDRWVTGTGTRSAPVGCTNGRVAASTAARAATASNSRGARGRSARRGRGWLLPARLERWKGAPAGLHGKSISSPAPYATHLHLLSLGDDAVNLCFLTRHLLTPW